MQIDATEPKLRSPPKPNQAILMVAVYEIIKGSFALLFAVMVWLWHDRLPHIIMDFTAILHHLMGSLLATQIDHLNLLADKAVANWHNAVLLAVGYALLRFLEAYGLYRDKTWAYWYSVLGYGIFLPIELYYLLSKPFDWVHLGVLLLNVIIVIVVYRNMKNKGLI